MGWGVTRTFTLSPIFCALNITFRIALIHSSLLGVDSADNLIVFCGVRNLISLSPDGSQVIAYRRSTTPCGKYGS